MKADTGKIYILSKKVAIAIDTIKISSTINHQLERLIEACVKFFLIELFIVILIRILNSRERIQLRIHKNHPNHLGRNHTQKVLLQFHLLDGFLH